MALNIAANERFDRGDRRANEIDTRAAASYQELQTTIGQMMAQFGPHGSLAARITLCERDIVDLERRVL